MTGLERFTDLMGSPNATGRDGIHISAQLRVDAMQLRAHRIPWVAECMERAANRIDELEDKVMKLTPIDTA